VFRCLACVAAMSALNSEPLRTEARMQDTNIAKPREDISRYLITLQFRPEHVGRHHHAELMGSWGWHRRQVLVLQGRPPVDEEARQVLPGGVRGAGGMT
jgi:hypothetical protein